MTVKLVVIALSIAVVLSLVVGFKLTRHGYESANYTVIRDEGPFEIRDYPDLSVVSTSMNPKRSGTDEGFMRLFRYISGANETEEKISMTVPVFSRVDTDTSHMSFLLPPDVVKNGAPEATSNAVRLETLPGGRFATYRFSGRWNTDHQSKAKEMLFVWLKEQSIDAIGEAMVASYDPPFTPPFMRRNEILVRIQSNQILAEKGRRELAQFNNQQ